MHCMPDKLHHRFVMFMVVGRVSGQVESTGISKVPHIGYHIGSSQQYFDDLSQLVDYYRYICSVLVPAWCTAHTASRAYGPRDGGDLPTALVTGIRDVPPPLPAPRRETTEAILTTAANSQPPSLQSSAASSLRELLPSPPPSVAERAQPHC